MQIKQVAEKLHTTTRTIRYYEEKGLIEPEKMENDYRVFNEEQVEQLKVILALREVGMSTSQIKQTITHQGAMDRKLSEQRSALYSEWLEIRDMVETLDDLLKSDQKNLVDKARALKQMKEKRKSWKDQWDFDSQAGTYQSDLKKEGHGFNVHEGYDEALGYAHRIVEAKVGETGLDIGIGTGNLGSRYLADGASVIGVDQSEEMLKMCREQHPEIDTRSGHFLQLPVMSQSVDFITTSYALHHVKEEDKPLALEEMARVLKPNGRLVIADLMFDDEEGRRGVLRNYEAAGNDEAVEAIEDEYYGNRSRIKEKLMQLGYRVKVRKINHILTVIHAEK
ncbi:MerR family transcriptional regulator [Halobacillus litoralis]|uniref:MerR family transcriptional regulator n=1 Tax=Halobacillus litoralis TaxID=45668 RepID=UPI001CD505A9|nr:MerR family transcriptional regulator [Halobacillus litoralis]MCA0970250.1 MerR family transcriptional regulator [Halobacillus litoralis]